MKKIFLAVVALAAMTACSNDDVVSYDKGQAIAFGDAFVNNSTRATDYTYGEVDLTSFKVYGTVTGEEGTLNIFNGVVLEGTVGNKTWSYKDKDTQDQYWLAGASYEFAAVVDAEVSNPTDPFMPETLAPDAADNGSNFKDMLYATTTATVSDQGVPSVADGIVNFTFEHLLSKVQFTVTSNAKGDYSHSVTGITVENYKTGAYTIAVDGDGEDVSYWAVDSGVDNKKYVEFGVVEDVTVADATGKTNATQMLLIPTTDDFTVSFTVETYLNDTLMSVEPKTVTVDNDLVKGHSYNFTIACAVNAPIKFSVTADPTWDSTNGTVTVQ